MSKKTGTRTAAVSSARPLHEIRADYDQDTIVVYQAYSPAIALPAVREQRFVPPFSLGRMTWIKPSFRWLMHRSGWATKPGQEHALAVRITRAGWEEALSRAVPSSPDRRLHHDTNAWRQEMRGSDVRVQWDPEYSLRDAKLDHRSIQVGLSRDIIGCYVEEWTVEIRDLTPLAHRIHRLVKEGRVARARELLPPERVYPLPPGLESRLGIRR